MISLAVALPALAEKHTVQWQGTTFHTYTVPPARVELYWQAPDGRPFRQFRALQAHLDS